MRKIDVALNRMSDYIDNFRDHMRSYHDLILDLERGKLTETILTPIDLRNILTQITLTGLSSMELSFYYETIPVEFLWKNSEHVVYRLVIPTIFEHEYLLYEIQSFSVAKMTSEIARICSFRRLGRFFFQMFAIFAPSNSPLICMFR